MRVNGEVCSLEDEIRLDKRKKHSLELVVDRLKAKAGLEDRLADSVETALRSGEGVLIVSVENKKDLLFSEHRGCHHCGIGFPDLSPQLFSFNSPQGMCRECNGLGTRAEMDVDLMVPDPSLSINEGAIKPMGPVGEKTGWSVDIVRGVAKRFKIDLDKPWSKLTKKDKKHDLARHRGREDPSSLVG